MAKISALPVVSALDGSERVPVVQGGVAHGVTVAQLADYILQLIGDDLPQAIIPKGQVFEGDSRVWDGADPEWPYIWAKQFSLVTGLPYTNLGVGGMKLVDMDAQYASRVGAAFNASNRDSLAILAGINDLGKDMTGTVTDATLRTAIQSLCAKARATGYRKICIYTVPGTTFNPGAPTWTWNATKQGYLDAYNAWLRANWASIGDKLVDIAALPQFSDPDNTAFFSDKLHFTPSLAWFLVKTLQAALALPTVSPDSTPNAFSFSAITSATVSTQYATTAKTYIVGMTAPAAISVTGGEYQINDGAWTSAPGTIEPWSFVKIRQTSSASAGTTSTLTLTVGGVSASRTVTTAGVAPPAGPFQWRGNVEGQTGYAITARQEQVSFSNGQLVFTRAGDTAPSNSFVIWPLGTDFVVGESYDIPISGVIEGVSPSAGINIGVSANSSGSGGTSSVTMSASIASGSEPYSFVATAATMYLVIAQGIAPGNDSVWRLNSLGPLAIAAPALPTIWLSGAVSQSEGNSGTTNYTYTATRSKTTGAVSAQWTFDAGATSPSDFVGGNYPAGGNVNFADGAASATITIQVQGDTDIEPNESFTVTIAAPSGYAQGSPVSATGTITNDDSASLPVFVNPPVVGSGTYSNSNRTIADMAAPSSVRFNAALTGKKVWAVRYDAFGSNPQWASAGITDALATTSGVGFDTHSIGLLQSGGFYAGGFVGGSTTAIAAGDIIGFLFDQATKKLWITRNGTAFLGNSTATTNAAGVAAGTEGLALGAWASAAAALYPAVGANANAGKGFTIVDYPWAPPSGFTKL